MKPPRFTYERPATLHDAIALLSRYGGEAKPIAGGQSLMPLLVFRLTAPKALIDIGRLPDLDRIDIRPDGVRLGALVRWRDIERDAALRQAHPLLVAATSHVAPYQIRYRGTVGGSLAHADPAAELPGVAVVCDAAIDIVGPRGPRQVPAGAFFTGPLMTVLEPDELITAIRFPRWPSGRCWAFEEFARRKGDFAIVGVALFYDRDAAGRVSAPHVGVIGIGDQPVRLRAVEQIMTGQAISPDLIRSAAAAGAEESEPQDDIHADAVYRRALIATLLGRALARAAGLTEPETP